MGFHCGYDIQYIFVFFSPHDHLWFTILPPCKYHKLAITIIDKHLEKAFH